MPFSQTSYTSLSNTAYKQLLLFVIFGLLKLRCRVNFKASNPIFNRTILKTVIDVQITSNYQTELPQVNLWRGY